MATTLQAILYSPNVLIPTEEKIIVDDGGGPDMLQEKKSPMKKLEDILRIPEPAGIVTPKKPWAGTLVDTVYSLRDQVKALEMEQKRMRKDLEEEGKARKTMETLLKNLLKASQAPGAIAAPHPHPHPHLSSASQVDMDTSTTSQGDTDSHT